MKLETTEGSHGKYIGIKNLETGKQVAQVKWGEGDGDLANLICAAPELMAQLEAFMELAGDWFTKMPEDWRGRMVCAGEAINKARGSRAY